MSREGVIGRKVTCDRQRHIVTGIGFSDAWPCFGLKLRVHHVTGRFHEWPGLVKVEKRSKSMRGGRRIFIWKVPKIWWWKDMIISWNHKLQSTRIEAHFLVTTTVHPKQTRMRWGGDKFHWQFESVFPQFTRLCRSWLASVGKRGVILTSNNNNSAHYSRPCNLLLFLLKFCSVRCKRLIRHNSLHRWDWCDLVRTWCVFYFSVHRKG